jgi:hypothetical protein
MFQMFRHAGVFEGRRLVLWVGFYRDVPATGDGFSLGGDGIRAEQRRMSGIRRQSRQHAFEVAQHIAYFESLVA